MNLPVRPVAYIDQAEPAFAEWAEAGREIETPRQIVKKTFGWFVLPVLAVAVLLLFGRRH